MLIVEKSFNKSENHEKTKSLILRKLDKLSVEYKIIEDIFIEDEDFGKYYIIMSLGGDGTFLKVAKKIKNQLIIGVNSDVENSVGFLKEFDEKNILNFFPKIKNKDFKLKKFNRIGASLNGKKLNQLAVNEIFIGNNDIRKVSHLDIEINNKKSFVRGNGIIISTKEGSNAFYKSAGGKKFIDEKIGYVFVLPYSIDGDLSKNEIFNGNTKIKIIAKRSHHIISFDSDIKNDYKLEKGDVVEVFVDKNSELRVVCG